MRITVIHKETKNEVMTFDYKLEWLDPKVASLYALQSAKMSIEDDASDIMSMIIWIRNDALAWTIFKSEAEQIIEMEKMFDIIYEDMESKIHEATEVKDLFN